MTDLERPPRWGPIAIVVLMLANLGLIVVLVQRQGSSPVPPPAVAAATGMTTIPTSRPGDATPIASAPVPTDGGGVLTVYGDGYSSGNSEGGVGASGWPELVAAQLGMELQLNAATLTGYVQVGSTDQTYPQLVQAAPPGDASVTVVFGSRNDVDATPTAVRDAATQTFQAIVADAPGTELLVIGPCWSSAEVPAALAAISDAVRQAAEAAGGIFVDPVAAGWFAEPGGLVSPIDNVSILNAGHAHLAGLIAPLVAAARVG